MDRERRNALLLILLILSALPGWLMVMAFVVTAAFLSARPYEIVSPTSPDGAYQVVVTRQPWTPTE